MNDINQFYFKKKNKYTTEKKYIIGFVFSVILTILPFGLVMNYSLSNKFLIWSIIITAIIQILVHLIYFLHIKTDKNNFWNILALIFTIFIIIVIIIGSVWIMNHLNTNMMLN